MLCLTTLKEPQEVLANGLGKGKKRTEKQVSNQNLRSQILVLTIVHAARQLL